ncbi:MAG: hypothetical protein RJA70_370 [Pseudomonadota bacterium]|jgi:hypothetical protein
MVCPLRGRVVNTMTPILDVARQLAEAHRKEDPTTKEIYLAEDGNEVRLVEVSGSVGTSGEVLPFRFAARPDKGIPYMSTVLLLSEEEWRLVKAGELHLPEGWGSHNDLKKIA